MSYRVSHTPFIPFIFNKELHGFLSLPLNENKDTNLVCAEVQAGVRMHSRIIDCLLITFRPTECKSLIAFRGP